jgi:ribosomal protein S18 acetylase RimI-like enzyme
VSEANERTGWVSWRPMTESDGPALFAIYASTREAELAVVDWTPEEKHQFLLFQFNAQHQHYMQHFADADFGLLMMDSQAIGRLYVRETPERIHIIDIALLPQFRRRGIATGLLSGIVRRGSEAGLPVSIHVEMHNPARALYERLGFRLVEERGMYLYMECPAAAQQTGRMEQMEAVCP